MFDYSKEPRSDILCVDVKSFYASVECVERGLDPLKAMLIVMSNAENSGGLVLAASPMAKKVLGISNVSRANEIPPHPDLIVVPPRMKHYIDVNMKINQIFLNYVADEDLHIYSIDESFLSIRSSLKLFKMTPYQMAEAIQRDIYKELGLYVTIGIGDNMLLSKLALDNEAKQNDDFIAEWRYEDVPDTIWKIKVLSDMWGIGSRTEEKLKLMGIRTGYDLAHYDYYLLKRCFGVIGEQLYACAWGIDRSNIREKYIALEKSFGNSQVLPRDYTNVRDIKIVIREMAEQVATRIRKHHFQTGCVRLYIGYSYHESSSGFNRQMKIPLTSNSKKLTAYCMELFDRYYDGKIVRHVGITYSKLVYTTSIQLDLFEEPEQQLANENLDKMIDKIREKYGFKSLVHASSLLEGGTAISRSSLVGGHAGGMEGLE